MFKTFCARSRFRVLLLTRSFLVGFHSQAASLAALHADAAAAALRRQREGRPASPADADEAATVARGGAWRLLADVSAAADGAEHPEVLCVAPGADGASVLTSNGDGVVRMWRGDGELARCFESDGAADIGPICCVSSCVDAGRIAAACGDGHVRVWDADSGDSVALFACVRENGATACAFSFDGNLVASVSNAAPTVSVWDVTQGEVHWRSNGEQMGDRTLCCVAWSPSGTEDCLLIEGNGHTLELWNVAATRCVSMFRGHNGAVASCCFDGDGRRALTSGACWRPMRFARVVSLQTTRP